MSSCMCDLRKDGTDQTQSCCLFVEVSAVAVSLQFHSPDKELRYVFQPVLDGVAR